MKKIEEALNQKPFSIVAHRGGIEKYPENTLAAIKYALQIKADIIEVDIRKTKDGELILLHDKDFERVAGIKKRADELDFSYIKEHILIQNSELVASLREVLEYVNGKSVLFLEIKEPLITKDVLKLIDEFNAWEWVGIISFYEKVIKSAKEAKESIKCGLIYKENSSNKIEKAKKLGADFVLPKFHLATFKVNKLAHELGLKVVAWTINDEIEALKLYEMGVDAIATDYPKEMLKLKSKLIYGGVVKKQNIAFEFFKTKDGVLLKKIELNKEHFFLEQNPHKKSKYGLAYSKLKEIYPSFYMFWEIKNSYYTGRLLMANIVKKQDIDGFIDKVLQDESYKTFEDFNDEIGGD